MKSSANSRRSKPKQKKQVTAKPGAVRGPLLFLCAVSATALALVVLNGWTLWYGDANAHLNIARRIFDSRQPGYEQLGTVWLPLPHLLTLPLVQSKALWMNGLSGAIPAAVCFVAGGLFLYLTLRRLFQGPAPAWAGLLVYALNPNLLYLQSTPMTETVSLIALLGLLFFTVRFGQTTSWGDAIGAGVFALAGALARYDGWFLLPFAASWILWRGGQGRWGKALLFCAVAGLGPLWWLGHNQYFYSNPLEFYNGRWSAKMIYQRALDAGGFRYPGDHDWLQAWRQYRAAAELCAGQPLAWAGVGGLIAALWRRVWWAALVLALVPAFYLLSLYSSGTPIFVPNLWPNSYYNTRYGIHALPLFCLGVAALVSVLPGRLKAVTAVVAVAACAAPWILYPRKDNWVTWKEAQVNSVARRTWTQEASKYLRARYRPGAGIWMSFGDLTGILREAGIPLRESFHEGDGLGWEAAAQRPDLFLREEWALSQEGDRVSNTLRNQRKGWPRFVCVRMFALEGEKAVEIWRRVGR